MSTNLEIAAQIVEAMRLIQARFWMEWGPRFDAMSEYDQEKLQQELQILIEAERLRLSGGATDDHLVKARNIDATAVGGLIEKTAPSATITPELFVDPSSGVERVRFNASPVQSSGGSWLYTGSIQATNLLDPVKAFVKAAEGSATISAGTALLFNVLPNGDLERKAVGQLHGLDPTGSETFVLAQGQRAWCAFTGTDNKRAGGICTILTLGDASTKAVLRPVPGEMVTGNTFGVVGVGAEFEGWYWEIGAEDPVTYWLTYRPNYVNTTTYNLLTSTQVSQAGSVQRETSVTVPGGSSGGVNFAIPLFEMLDGLNAAKIPKGVVNWEVLAYVVVDDPAATTFIRAFLSTDQGVLQNFGLADSPPIHATSPTLLRFQGTIPNDRAVNPTDKLSAVFYGYSNSPTDITIKLVYNSASHATRVQTPIEVASYGTLDHGLLTPSSRKFVAGENPVDYAHPARGSSVATNSFTGRLSSADTDVQKALDTLSKRESAHYYLGGSPSAPVLSRFPSASAWDSGALAIAETPVNVLTASSAGYDPGLIVTPAGHHLLRLVCSASVAAQVHLVVKVGTETVAVSDWTAAPQSSGGVVEVLALAVDLHPDAVANTDHVTIELLAATVAGSGTIRILSGGEVSTTLACPWLTEVSSHRASELYPNRPRVLDRTVATVNGVLTVPTDCGNSLRVSGTEPLATIAAANWDLLSRLTLHFTQGRDVQNATGNIRTMMPEWADPTITVVQYDTMTLWLEDIDGTKTWIRETNR